MENIINHGNAEMIERTKLASFYLWEYTGHENTLALWYCSEDIASFFERCQMYTEQSVLDIFHLNRNTREYRAFIRHIAYRLHLYTGIGDDGFNWNIAERLLDNRDWRDAIIFLACGFHELREGHAPESGYQLQSPAIKEYYSQNRL
ncbi:MAG: hypothetical protein FWE91_08585 [Defluviitaleaceae bacterium]|nr:hypothetical protein [Defluviitaleaceae bacterium]MCL2835255.1 hypothetical protein [Defluviitaleaceae bacterium]